MWPWPTITFISARFPRMETAPLVRLKRRSRRKLWKYRLRGAPGAKALKEKNGLIAALKALRHPKPRLSVDRSAREECGGTVRNDGCTPSDLVLSTQVNCSCQTKLWTTAASTAMAVAAR